MSGPYWRRIRSDRQRRENAREVSYSYIAEVLGPATSEELIREAHSVPLSEIRQEPYETNRYYEQLRKEILEEEKYETKKYYHCLCRAAGDAGMS